MAEARQGWQSRKSERGAAEAELQATQNSSTALQAQKAETRARLDELDKRLISQKTKIESALHAIQASEANAKKAEQAQREARDAREKSEENLHKASDRLEQQKKELEQLEAERRTKLEDRANHQARHSRLQAQLEVLEQAEQSLAGYAEGARYLLEAARNSRLNARGALSAILDVPSELETAIAAALGDTLDAVLLESDQIEEALRLLESDEAGRAALLPLDSQAPRSLKKPDDPDCLGLASELVSAPVELRTAVDRFLGETLVVRTRAAGRRLIADIRAHARIVTLRGEGFSGDGLIISGYAASYSTLIWPGAQSELT